MAISTNPYINETSLVASEQEVLVDDFTPQPLQGDSVYYYNRLGGDRGALNHSILTLSPGKMTITLGSGDTWGGIWFSLNHPRREGLGLNFSAVFPCQILPKYQSKITGIAVAISGGTAGKKLKLELKDRNNIRWTMGVNLLGGAQVLRYDLPPLDNIDELDIVLDQVQPGNQVILDEITLYAATEITDPMEAAFVWSYGMLLNNWNPATGLTRDKTTDASGEFDAVQSTGALAAATAVAEQLGVITRPDAIQIVSKIADALLNHLPTYKGLWPHWVQNEPTGTFSIVEGTEWSAVDTVIAALGLLDAQAALGMDPSGIEQFLREIDWAALCTPNGLSHGYTYQKEPIPYAWDTFGGESWIVSLLYTAVIGQPPPLKYPTPPTANGSGFIDELAWLFVLPPTKPDIWGVNWATYRVKAVDDQLRYIPIHYPDSCFAKLGIFGLSAGEVPSPSDVPKTGIYQAFGIGGRFSPPVDEAAILAGPVVTPHYSAMVAFLRPQESTRMWIWLINGPFSPLNNIESLSFPPNSNCEYAGMTWNSLKGSWNLALQTLGLGRYLVQRSGMVYSSQEGEFIRLVYPSQ